MNNKINLWKLLSNGVNVCMNVGSILSILKLRIKELLHILKEKPVLNRQLGTQSKYEVKTILVPTYAQFKSGEDQEIEEDM